MVASFTPGAAGARTFDFKGATGLFVHIPILGLNTFPLAMVGTAVPTGLLNVTM